MSLRVPLTPDRTLQVEFHEIERRLRAMERRTGLQNSRTTLQIIGGSGGAVDLKPITDRLNAIEIRLGSVGNPAAAIPDFGGVGPESNRGLVPAPGTAEPPTGVGQHLLTESGEWGFPLRGLVGVATSGVQTDIPCDRVSILADVHMQDLSATRIECQDIAVYGTAYIQATIDGGVP
jgi:hypothetical protein